ncbi:MAG: glycoside hydrolase family 88 protein [Lachnospiraceae bacterium]
MYGLEKEQIEQAKSNALAILKENLKDFTYVFQYANSENNRYAAYENTGWTTGFVTGEYWLAYEMTGDEAFKQSADIQVQSFLDRIIAKKDVDHHDMGFLYTLSCVAAYKLTGNETGKKAALLAADQLISRFQEKGEFIQAWGVLGAEDNYRLIIDCLLNVPLLYWATEVSGNEIYANIADRHTKTSLANLIREDNSTYHTFFFDPETGAPLRGLTHQGYKDGSAWARGQAWGIYGTALSYHNTKNEVCIELFEKITDYFISRLPKDHVPYWDLTFIDGEEPRDSSAGAIAVCGMLEMAKHLPKEKADYYTEQAHIILKSLIEQCGVASRDISDGLLLHGVYAKNSPYNPIKKDRGVDECNTWGDYFYMEALMRLSADWNMYW